MSVKKKDIKRLISKLDKLDNVSEEVILFLRNNYYKMFGDSFSSSYINEEDLPIKGKTFPNSRIVKKFISSNINESYSYAFTMISEKDWANITSLLKDNNKLHATKYLKNTLNENITLRDAKDLIDNFYQLISNG